jgi:hypothetical protein
MLSGAAMRGEVVARVRIARSRREVFGKEFMR